MNICPYCRCPVEPENEHPCPACAVVHHADCFAENGGCTVFGCQAAPPAEPMLHLSADELVQPVSSAAFAPITPPPPPPAAAASVPQGTTMLFSSAGYGSGGHARYRQAVVPPHLLPMRFNPALQTVNRNTYIVLGILLGPLGIHNFYAGYRKRALWQLVITVLSLGIASLPVWVWAIIDVVTITADPDGIPFRS